MNNKGTVIPFFVALDAFVKKGSGIDLVLKSLLGIVRLMSVYSGDAELRENSAAVAFSIINCRMLSNHFRHIVSLVTAVRIAKKKDGSLLAWLSLAASFFFRTFEQIFGDLNYYQMTFMHHWSRTRLTYGYYFFKSIGLTCGLINELTNLGQVLSKSGAERTESMCAFMISVARYLFDMAVYFQWLSWYNPSRPVQYACGSSAGLLGVYVVWNETRAALEAPPVPLAGAADPSRRAVAAKPVVPPETATQATVTRKAETKKGKAAPAAKAAVAETTEVADTNRGSSINGNGDVNDNRTGKPKDVHGSHHTETESNKIVNYPSDNDIQERC